MNFDLSEDQVLLQDGITEMLKSELSLDHLREAVYTKNPFKPELWQAINEFGLLGLLVPEEFNGSEFSLLEAIISVQQAGRALLPLPLTGHLMTTLALVNCDNAEIQSSLLPALASGELVATASFENTLRAEESRDCCLQWVEYAADADLLLVCSQGDGVGLVDLRRINAEIVDAESVDLSRPSAHICFPRECIQPLTGVSIQSLMSAWRLLLAADSWGVSRFMIDTTVEYAVTRKQFGRLIGEFQSVKHPLAEATLVHKFSEPMLWSAASLWGGDQRAFHEMALLSKAHITETSVVAIRECIQLMGAYGFAWESDLHLWLKRAISNAGQLGAPRDSRRELAEMRGWMSCGS